eukprot:TRINITY_DN48311_c0_g1_i1.p1 TRINITY_DN48311_c0_g1~~TRINITY_DN48311_c0_g1_i1.p1  ORF type:complete len:564 (+),score=82.48 TRINITY_DN48311_c0_g1_i1:47-1693(+)
MKAERQSRRRSCVRNDGEWLRRHFFVNGSSLALSATFCKASIAEEHADWCWSDGFTPELCCGPTPVVQCFDAVHTEEQCCGSSYHAWESPLDEAECFCGAGSESFIHEVVSATSMPLGVRSVPSGSRQGTAVFKGSGQVADLRPLMDATQATTLCTRFGSMVASVNGKVRLCPTARFVGEAVCAHSAATGGRASEAAEHAASAAEAAAFLARRHPPFCPSEIPRLVSSAFPFSESEAFRNAARLRQASEQSRGGDAKNLLSGGWRREWKPQLGARSELDEISLKYRSPPRVRIWQKQFGCSGGDTGYEHNFFSQLYARLFDHRVPPGASPPGPSRHRPLRVLEVGICDGSGLALWSEYFYHRDSRVVALDLDFRLFIGNSGFLCQKGFNRTRLSAMIQANASDLQSGDANVTVGRTMVTMSALEAVRAQGPFDFIRDDASHLGPEMIAAFKVLFPSVLRPGGVYVIEDVWTWPFTKNTSTSLDDSGEFSYFFSLARDALNHGWRFSGEEYSGTTATSWIQSPDANDLEAWVSTVEFSKGQIVIRKRGV